MRVRLCVALGLVAATLGATRPVHADPAAAEALFREGHQLLIEGKYEAAAAKLAASQALDPASGTLINLALAYERQGRLATAWATYREAAILARRDGRADRVASAERKQAELEPRVPQLTFHAEHPVDALSISWAQLRVGAGALDSKIPVDPGPYRILVQAPGHKAWTTDVKVVEGEQQLVTIPELEPDQASPEVSPLHEEAARPKSAASSPKPTAIPPRLPDPAPDRTLAWALGASGIVSLGIGAAFGLRALGTYADAEHDCPSHTGCESSALDTWRSARTSAWISNVGVGVGAIACVGSAWLFFGPSRVAPRRLGLAVTPLGSGAGITVRSQL
jgi:hypothetical protein